MSATTVVKEPVLPWMRVPVSIEAGQGINVNVVNGLSCNLKEALETDFGFHEFFPVQSVTWRETAGGSSSAHDICIAAPTGSGKTLAYALPIINELSRQRLNRDQLHYLRGLVVLPTRDLAAQVFQVFQPLCRSVGLNVALVAARSSVQTEAKEIVSCGKKTWGADVVIATPGRLTAHLHKTKGFNFKNLKFLVVDETDRLLRQSYQEWLPLVLEQISREQYNAKIDDLGDCQEDALTFSRVVKYIVSATLTRDPSKLERLQLHCPRYIATSNTGQRYNLPKNLLEYKVVCSGSRKPLMFLALLQHLREQSTVVFASSLDMAHKLQLLVRAVEGLPEAVVFSSRTSVMERAAAVDKFKSGEVKLLVASDALTRGIDLEGIQNVVNYDTPVYAKTYVHRAGRTARAGKSGRVFSLLRPNDMRHFRAMLRKADNNLVSAFTIPQEDVDSLKKRVAAAVREVQALLALEQDHPEQAVADKSRPMTAK